ncbi:MAG TPA: hypothetical protein VGH30_03280 [Jatrophihabitantaceae bacterium]|jgi:hypothetical protein
MAAVTALPRVGQTFFDVRDDGRSMRVSWHPQDDFFVLSMWRDGTCVATFRLDGADATDLVVAFGATDWAR